MCKCSNILLVFKKNGETKFLNLKIGGFVCTLEE